VISLQSCVRNPAQVAPCRRVSIQLVRVLVPVVWHLWLSLGRAIHVRGDPLGLAGK